MDIRDTIIIVLYILGIVGAGYWVGIRKRRGSEVQGYFLAGRTLTWSVIGLSLFSTNISSVHLVSLAQEGYRSGLAYGNFEWMAAFTLIALSLFFAPFYIRAQISTLPGFLEKRYNKACRDWLAILSIVSAVFIHIGFSLYAGAVVLKSMFGMNIFMSIILAAVFSGIYTIKGGLSSVALTSAFQTVIMVGGAIVLTVIGLQQVGGWQGLVSSVENVKLTVLRPTGDSSGLPWYSVFLGYPVIGLWYWCADQTIVQRVLGAKDENHARVGPLFAGFLKILPVFIFVLPGLICLGLVNQGKLPAGINESADNTYAFMISHLLPVGLKGLLAAALLAALMSTVAGALNSIGTLFSFDIYKRFRPQTSDRQLVFVGRIATFIAMIAAIAWSPFLGHFNSIFQGMNVMISYIAPPITVVFLWGVFWRRASSAGAEAALYAGSFLGLLVFLVDWFHTNEKLFYWLHKKLPFMGKLWNAWQNYNIPFMMMAFYLFAICSVILVIGSLWKDHRHTEESNRLVWSHFGSIFSSPGWKGLGNYKFLAGLLFVVMAILYVIFA